MCLGISGHMLHGWMGTKGKKKKQAVRKYSMQNKDPFT
jgi:hypothetical protein